MNDGSMRGENWRNVKGNTTKRDEEFRGQEGKRKKMREGRTEDILSTSAVKLLRISSLFNIVR